jgi:hypothetical protein
MSMLKDKVTATGLTAAGSTLATALPLNAQINIVSTAAASTGVSLPPNAAVGTEVFVANLGANAMNVYPATAAGVINGGSAGAAVSLAVTSYATRSREFVCVGTDVWVQKGVA